MIKITNFPFVVLDQAATRRVDSRGHLDVLYEQGEVVLKRSYSRAGVFRGMHWQRPPYVQTKLIRVASGRILDFVVDAESTERQLFYRELGPEDGWVQIGAHFAHGFYAMQDTEFEYLCHGAYNESAEQSYSIADFLSQRLGLRNVILSAKDAAAAPLAVTSAAAQG